MKYHYLLFDLDGTLTDSKPGITKCVQYALEKMGREVPPIEELLCFIGPPLLFSFQEFCNMNEEEAKKAVAFYRERYTKIGLFENNVYAGMLETLEKLKEKGYILTIATSKPEEYLVRILGHFHLTSYFTAISGSNLDGERNSKAEVIEDLLYQLAVWKEGGKGKGMFYRGQEAKKSTVEEIKKESIMIGDRYHDIEGAAYCGIDSLGVHYGYAKPGELEKAGAVYEVDTVEDLGNFFSNK